MQTLEQATEVLVHNCKRAIASMEHEGAVGISKACLRQNISTIGLDCSASMFEVAFDRAISKIADEQRLFVIY